MLKFLHVAQIFNFHTFLTDFQELLGLPYMVGNFEMSSFHKNLHHNKLLLVAPDISQTVHKCLV